MTQPIILGAQGTITNIEKLLQQIQDYAQKQNLIIQIFNADMIYGKQHLIIATEHATRAFKQKTNTTNSLEMEILLYAAGQRQLKHAIPKMGITKGTTNVAILITNKKETRTSTIDKTIQNQLLKTLNLKRNDTVLQGSEETLRNYGITTTEQQTVPPEKYGDLILEKIAMVDIIK
jgi:KEOPS complex subunit Cgi121